MKKEIWKDIPNYEGIYQASSYGRIKRLGGYTQTKYGRKFRDDLILKQSINDHGYLKVGLSNGTNKDLRKTRSVHQLVAEAFLGHVRCGLKRVVNHINFDKVDNRVENLEIVSQRENTNKKHLKSSSKYTGVSKSPTNGKWCASIIVGSRFIPLGTFDDELKASEAYENAVKEINSGVSPDNVTRYIRENKSQYKGVSYHPGNKKWIAQKGINGKVVQFGYFDTEYEAHLAYEKAMVDIDNGLLEKYIKPKRKKPSSIYKGVSYAKNVDKWRSAITVNGKPKCIGYFKTEIEAHIAYQNALKELSAEVLS